MYNDALKNDKYLPLASSSSSTMRMNKKSTITTKGHPLDSWQKKSTETFVAHVHMRLITQLGIKREVQVIKAMSACRIFQSPLNTTDEQK